MKLIHDMCELVRGDLSRYKLLWEAPLHLLSYRRTNDNVAIVIAMATNKSTNQIECQYFGTGGFFKQELVTLTVNDAGYLFTVTSMTSHLLYQVITVIGNDFI